MGSFVENENKKKGIIFNLENKQKIPQDKLKGLLELENLYFSYIKKILYPKDLKEFNKKRSKILLDYNLKKKRYIPAEIKNTVWKRDKGKCKYCNSTENLQYDHIIPFSKGGANSIENLQLLCEECNKKKTNKINDKKVQNLEKFTGGKIK